MLKILKKQLVGVVWIIAFIVSGNMVFAEPTFDKEMARKRTVQIIIKEKVKGAGIVLTKEGHILTANHVLKECRGGRAKVKYYRDGTVHEASVIDQKKLFDLALLKTNDQRALDPVLIGDSEVVKGGDELNIVGHPRPAGVRADYAVFSMPVKSVDSYGWILLNGVLHKGNSGGPVFDDSGKLVGIILKRSEYKDEAFCFPINFTNYFLVANGIVLKDGKSNNYVSDIDIITKKLKQYEQIYKWMMSDLTWEVELRSLKLWMDGKQQIQKNLVVKYTKKFEEQYTPDHKVSVKFYPIIKDCEYSLKQLKEMNIFYTEKKRIFESGEVVISEIPGKLEAKIDDLNEKKNTDYELSDVSGILVYIKAVNKEEEIRFPRKKIKIAYK